MHPEQGQDLLEGAGIGDAGVRVPDIRYLNHWFDWAVTRIWFCAFREKPGTICNKN
jgi:hypothetical protein